jgi:hypothetical protein
MKKRIFLVLATGFFFVFSASAQTIRERIRERMTGKQQDPGPAPAAPDYSNLYYWAAHPLKKDMSDSIPSFISNETRDTLADVFFLHPTTYIKDMRNAMPNADLMDTALNNATDRKTILFQSSVFNNCCRIFAPRYRQAHLKAYMTFGSEASQAAFDTAYEDLKNAFQYYLDHENKGRPVIIASHSQGAMHAVRLLQEFFDGKPLQKQLVCAYIVGWQIKPDDFKNIPVGETPDATGCFVGWRSYKKGEMDFIVKNERGGSVCVNPISWTTSTDETKPEQHKGAVGKDMNKIVRGVITASVEPEHKILWVDAPDKVKDKIGDKLKNYHVADYNLFWQDIRENAMLRVKAFLKIN